MVTLAHWQTLLTLTGIIFTRCFSDGFAAGHELMNSLFLSYWLNGLGWLSAGAVIGVVSINPLLSILLFDLPLALQYRRKGYFQVNTPFLVYGLGLLLFAVLGWAGLYFALGAAKQFGGYCLSGIGLCVVVVLLDLLFNPRNRIDFIRDNEAYLSPLGQHHLVENNPRLHYRSAQKMRKGKRSPRGLLLWLKRYLAFRLKLGSWIIVVE